MSTGYGVHESDPQNGVSTPLNTTHIALAGSGQILRKSGLVILLHYESRHVLVLALDQNPQTQFRQSRCLHHIAPSTGMGNVHRCVMMDTRPIFDQTSTRVLIPVFEQ